MGHIIAAGMNPFLTRRMGNGRVIVLGATLQAAGYAVLVAPPPFPVFPFFFTTAGLGIGLQLSHLNFYCSQMPNAASALGWLHGCKGLLSWSTI